MSIRLGIDVGGTGIKAARVDTTTGELVSERLRLKTPSDPTPANIAATVGELVSRFDTDGPIGCCFPAVIVDGEARTAGNIDDDWIGTSVAEVFRQQTGHDYIVVNDADGAAVAEMGLGVARDLQGMVLVLTIGTGIGSGMIYNGTLVPNLELGWMPSDHGMPMEHYASDKARKVHGLDWDAWGARFDYVLTKLARVFTPDHFVLGGGASKKLHKFEHKLTVDVPVHVAHFKNHAGIIGAALMARDA